MGCRRQKREIQYVNKGWRGGINAVSVQKGEWEGLDEGNGKSTGLGASLQWLGQFEPLAKGGMWLCWLAVGQGMILFYQLDRFVLKADQSD